MRREQDVEEPGEGRRLGIKCGTERREAGGQVPSATITDLFVLPPQAHLPALHAAAPFPLEDRPLPQCRVLCLGKGPL